MTQQELITQLTAKFGEVRDGNGDWVRIPCPTCLPKDRYKLKRGVNLVSLFTNCFICGVKQPVRELLNTADFKITNKDRPRVERPEHPQARVVPAKYVVPLHTLTATHPAVQFFAKDHLHDLENYWEKYFIGYIPDDASDDLIYKKPGRKDVRIPTANSIIFPVFFNKVFVGWQLRYVPDTVNGNRMIDRKMRYLHVFKKGEYLYNFDNAINYDSVVLVEGAKKALKLPNAVATLGKGITKDQIRLLTRWSNIIIFYDGEDETQEKASKLMSDFRDVGKQCISIDPRTYNFESPDEMTCEEAELIVFKEWKRKYE